MGAPNNFITDIMDQMVDNVIHRVTFMPTTSGAYMARPQQGTNKLSGRRVQDGDEFIEDMAALGIDVLVKKDEKYFIPTDDPNLFRRFKVKVAPAQSPGTGNRRPFIQLDYVGGYTEYRMNKELKK